MALGSSSCASPTIFNQNKPAVSAKLSSSSKPFPFHDSLAGSIQFLNFQESPRFCQGSINCKRLLSRRWIKNNFFVAILFFSWFVQQWYFTEGEKWFQSPSPDPITYTYWYPLKYLAYFCFPIWYQVHDELGM